MTAETPDSSFESPVTETRILAPAHRFRFREVHPVRDRAVRGHDIGHDIGEYDLRDADGLTSEEGIALVDQVQDRAHHHADDQRAARNAPRDAIDPVLFP